MRPIDPQSLPDVDDYAQQFPDDDVVTPPASYSIHVKPQRLTKLETLEQRAHALKDELVRNWVDLADCLGAIIDTDLWKQAGYSARRDYCDEQLGISYEYCRRIINGAVAVQQGQLVGRETSPALAIELARIPEQERPTVISTLEAGGLPVTADTVRVYRVVAARDESPTAQAICDYMNRDIESRIMLQARKHSDPPSMLRRLATLLEMNDQAKIRVDARTGETGDQTN